VVFAALPGSVARNSGLNVIDVYSAWPTSGYARYLSGPHETGIGSDITAQAVINAMPLQAITRNSQAGAFNGLLEAQSIKVRNTTASSEPYFFVAADRTGSLLLRRANDVYINNSIGATTAQVSNICIDGQVQAGTAFFTGTFATPPVSGNGLHIYTFSSNTYLDANNAALSSANILNLKASSILATCTIQGVSLFATGLSNPTGVAGVLGTFGSRAVLIGRNASSPLPVQVGEGTALYVNTDGRVFQGGLTTPTAWFHIRAGAAAANSAPLKFTSGTNLTTPEAGAMEYNGTNLFFTRVSTREGVLIGNRGASAPSTTAAGTVTNRYGGATNFLGDPNTWFSVVGDDGSTYKIPAYT
jgi:hypothetical protein